MRTGNRWALIVAAGALAVAMPAAAKPGHPAPPSHPAHPSHPAASHKCTPHNVAYTATGQLVSWGATQTGTGRYTGTITVHVTKANRHAAEAKGSDVTYTLTDARVKFGKGANPPTAGDRVKVIGKIASIGKKCDQSGFVPTITVHKVDVHVAKPRPPKG
jgi:hypothetical protein